MFGGYPQHQENDGYLSSSLESLPDPRSFKGDDHLQDIVPATSANMSTDSPNQGASGGSISRSIHHGQDWHAEATAKYQIDQVDGSEFDADLQIDNIIKNAPTSLQNKKDLKTQYSKQPKKPKKLSYWKSFKYSFGIKWSQFKYRVHDLSLQFEVWRSSLKVVEGITINQQSGDFPFAGRFGTAVVSYFIFLKWLLFLNIYITILVAGLMVSPQIIVAPKYIPSNYTELCEQGYSDTVDSICEGFVCVLDFLEGSGWMELTVLFYGEYVPYYITDSEMMEPGPDVVNNYNLPLAYLLTTVGIFLFSFLMMMNYTSKALQDSLANSEDNYFKYCNKVFCGWDFLLTDENSAFLKKESIRYELKSDLDEESRALQRASRTIWKKLRLYTIRLLLNLVVVAILGAAFYAIFYVTNFSIMNSFDPIPKSEFAQLVISFLPSITLTILNGIIPVVFNVIVRFEEYSPQFEIALTLIRTVFLRLASLVILFFSLYPQIYCENDKRDKECRFCTSSELRCWETAIGQEFYKLALTDFAAVLVVVFIVEFPRKLGAKYLKIGIAQTLGQMEFEIPKNVLSIVYSQALCWIGVFYCPFLPLMTAVKLFIIFYLKKLSLLSNMMPAQKPFRASRSGIFFMVILIVTFLICILPVGYFIVNIEPSRGCGPFRMQENGTFIWSELEESLEMWNSFLGDVFQFIGSPAFCVPLVIFLALLLYYYTAIGSAQLGMINLLKEQLILEGRDKHFLLTRIDELIQADLGAKKSFYKKR